MKGRLPFLWILVCIVNSWCFAQEVYDNNPSSLRWYQIKSPTFNVLFPEGSETSAQNTIHVLESLRKPLSATLGGRTERLPIILQNQSSISNGFVSMMPRRAELFLMPSQNYNFIGSNEWLTMLSIHEYRHVVQYQHALRGLNRIVYYAFGRTAFTGLSQLSVPTWFFEGDAVATETAFTKSGRGRIPQFDVLLKSNLLEGREFNYHKQYLQSYKHNISNHYVLGYHMVNHVREKTDDPMIWSKVTKRAWQVPIIPFRFSRSLKKYAGLNVAKTYNEMASALKSEWNEEIDQRPLTSFEVVQDQKSRGYTDYSFPTPMDDGSILVLKSGIGNIDEFVLLKDGKEKHVFTPGLVNETGMISASGKFVVWNEFGFDPRWTMRNFSQVKLLNIETGRVRVIGTKQSRLAGAALSPNGDRIAVIETNEQYQHQIVIYNATTGERELEFPNPSNHFYSMPRWSPNNSDIVVLKTSSAGKSLVVLSIDQLSETVILPTTHENIGHPIFYDQYIVFASGVNGVDNLYAVDTLSKERYQITTSRLGAYNPSISKDGYLYYNEQTRDGLDVVRTPLQPSSWKKNLHIIETSEPVVVSHEGVLPTDIDVQQYPAKRYRKASGWLRPYAWGAQFSNDLATVSASVTSRDLLNTMGLQVGYVYDVNERTNYWQAGISYQGWYPILNFNFTEGNREDTRQIRRNTASLSWKEQTVQGGFMIPLNLTHSKYHQALSFGNNVGATVVRNFQNTLRDEDGGVIMTGVNRYVPYNDTLNIYLKDQISNTLIYNHAWVSYQRLLKRSHRDFLPRLGQTLNVSHFSTPYGGNYKGSLFAVRSSLFFPGLFKHHFLYGRVAWQYSEQNSDPSYYTFRNQISKPRGYAYPSDQTFTTLSANYAFPLWYPDIAIGPLVNIQRIKLNVFYDYGKGSGRNFYYHKTLNHVYQGITDATYNSVGGELTVDVNLFRLLPKFEFGMRGSYRLANAYENKGTLFEIFLGNIGF
jgi:hypothetical protein